MDKILKILRCNFPKNSTTTHLQEVEIKYSNMCLEKILTALFDTIYRSYYTISANFYLYLQYIQQTIFNFNKINGFQTDSN